MTLQRSSRPSRWAQWSPYYDRVSLFRLEVKRGNGEWYDWSGEEVFAVHGNTPQPQYNQMLVYLIQTRIFMSLGLSLSAAMLGLPTETPEG